MGLPETLLELREGWGVGLLPPLCKIREQSRLVSDGTWFEMPGVKVSQAKARYPREEECRSQEQSWFKEQDL